MNRPRKTKFREEHEILDILWNELRQKKGNSIIFGSKVFFSNVIERRKCTISLKHEIREKGAFLLKSRRGPEQFKIIIWDETSKKVLFKSERVKNEKAVHA